MSSPRVENDERGKERASLLVFEMEGWICRMRKAAFAVPATRMQVENKVVVPDEVPQSFEVGVTIKKSREEKERERRKKGSGRR